MGATTVKEKKIPCGNKTQYEKNMLNDKTELVSIEWLQMYFLMPFQNGSNMKHAPRYMYFFRFDFFLFIRIKCKVEKEGILMHKIYEKKGSRHRRRWHKMKIRPFRSSDVCIWSLISVNPLLTIQSSFRERRNLLQNLNILSSTWLRWATC